MVCRRRWVGVETREPEFIEPLRRWIALTEVFLQAAIIWDLGAELIYFYNDTSSSTWALSVAKRTGPAGT
jgi:hypothetical protein